MTASSYFIPARTSWTTRGKSLFSLYERNRTAVRLTVLVTGFCLAAIWPWICITVPAGHVAVEWYRFLGGTDVEHVRPEGARFIFPWDKLAIYDTRIQQATPDFDVLSSDGLTIGVNVAVRFRVNPITVGLLHKYVGPDYANNLILLAVGAYARAVLARNSTEQIYTARRLELQDEIKRSVIADLMTAFDTAGRPEQAWIFLDDVLIRSMRFPASVQAAINRKMEQHQLQQEYAYRLEREQLESKRKAIEADGIAHFQATVSSSISDAYLRWRSIEAALALAQSPNAKTVVLGGGRDGMPIILGDGVTPETQIPHKMLGSEKAGQYGAPATPSN